MGKPTDSPLGEDFRTRWKLAFERYAALHDDDAGIAGWTPSGLEARVRLFRRLWSVQRPGSLWLDIGCGAGTYTRLLSSEGLHVVGIDYSLPTLAKARARSPEGIRWMAADVTNLPIRSGACDGALCFGVLQAIPSSERALRAIASAMKPGGKLWVDALNRGCLPNKLAAYKRQRAGRPAHLRYETAESLILALESSGFESVKLYWVPIVPPRLQRLQGLIEGRVFRWLLRRCPPIANWLSHSMLIEARRCRAEAS